MFFPYSTERQLRQTPWATLSLIGANTILFVVTWTNRQALQPLILDPENFRLWQPLTALFMHAGPLHLGGNMLFLWIFGSHMEDVLGPKKFLLVYFSAGFSADIAQTAFDLWVLKQVRPSLGASGAVMGLVALFATRFRSVKVNIFYWWWFWLGTWHVEALWVALFYIAGDLVFGLLGALGMPGSVAHFAHLGGFACGIIFGYGLRLPDEAEFDEGREKVARQTTYGPRAAAGSAVALAARRPDDPRSHWLAAAHLAADDEEFDRALHHWNAAMRLWLARGQDVEVIQRWEWLADRYDPAHQLDPDVLFKIAGTMESAGETAEACKIFAALASDYQQHRHAPQCALHVADILAHQDRPRQARQWYNYVRRTWPDSYQALDAKTKMYAIDDDT